jgi:outer membrane autotransporter protein
LSRWSRPSSAASSTRERFRRILVSGVNQFGVTSTSGGITNSGTISAGSYGIFVRNISTFAGNISNSGTITGLTGIRIGTGVSFAAGAAIVNSGAITGTGGTAINAAGATSAVTILQNAGTISGNVLLSANADTMTIAGGTVVGNIVGQNAGTLNFSLPGGTTYTDSNTFTLINQVNINSGTVLLNSTDSANAIDVLSGATLGGTGTLDPLAVTIHAGGTFAPGVPGTFMNITGNLVLQSAAVYLVTINGANASGSAIAGTATVAGAIAAGNAASTPIVGHTYTIMTAAGGVSGTFADPTFFFGAYEGVLSYGTTFVDLTVQNGALLLPSGAPTNVVNVGNGINTAIQNGVAPPPGFQNLFNFTPAQIENALTQLEGQVGTDSEKGAYQLMTDFLNLLLDPSLGGGSSSGTGGAQGFAPDDQPSLPPDIAQAYNSVLKAPQAAAPSFDQRWSAWGSAFGGANTTNGNAQVGSNNVTASVYGFAGGMTYHVTPQMLYGFALAGGGTNWNLTQALGTGRSDAVVAGVYGVTHFGPAYLSTALGFANHWFTTNRIAPAGDQLTANFDGQSYGARFETGYRYAVPLEGVVLGVTPYAALQPQFFHTPGYSETDLTTGGFGLSYNAMNATDARGEVGARFDDLTMLNGMPLVLRGRLAWAHDWVSNPSLGAVFQTLPGSNFTVYGAAPPTNSALASAGGQLFLTPNWSVEAKFDGEFASTAKTYGGTATLKYSW